jgi:hypothetical protein
MDRRRAGDKTLGQSSTNNLRRSGKRPSGRHRLRHRSNNELPFRTRPEHIRPGPVETDGGKSQTSPPRPTLRRSHNDGPPPSGSHPGRTGGVVLHNPHPGQAPTRRPERVREGPKTRRPPTTGLPNRNQDRTPHKSRRPRSKPGLPPPRTRTNGKTTESSRLGDSGNSAPSPRQGRPVPRSHPPGLRPGPQTNLNRPRATSPTCQPPAPDRRCPTSPACQPGPTPDQAETGHGQSARLPSRRYLNRPCSTSPLPKPAHPSKP